MVDVRYSVRETVGIAELSREAGRLEGHIAGLKEALEIAASSYGAKHKEIAASICSRIAELEKGNTNG